MYKCIIDYTILTFYQLETLKASMELLYNSELPYEEVFNLIPIKTIGKKEAEIQEILDNKLLELFQKINSSSQNLCRKITT